MYIYFAHPIDQVKGPARGLTTAIAYIAETIRQQGHAAFLPARAHLLSDMREWADSDMRAVDAINRNALWESDGLVALVLPGVPTLGVPAEIELALSYNRPTCIVTTEKLRQSSIQLANWASRGATIVFCSDTGALHNLNLADALGSLPDPTQLILREDVIATDSPLLVKRISTNAKVPTRAYRGDAGLDLAVVGEHDIHPGEYKLLPTGIAAAVPDGWWGFMTGRSSAWSEWRFEIKTAVIDSGYRGELMVGVTNKGSERKSVMPGTRLAQYVLLPAFMGDVQEVDDLAPHERGTNGYGSSGA
jgi:dUTP pyrophosphatase